MRKGVVERRKMFLKPKQAIPNLFISETPELKRENYVSSKACHSSKISSGKSYSGSHQISPPPKSPQKIRLPTELEEYESKYRTEVSRSCSPNQKNLEVALEKTKK